MTAAAALSQAARAEALLWTVCETVLVFCRHSGVGCIRKWRNRQMCRSLPDSECNFGESRERNTHFVRWISNWMRVLEGVPQLLPRFDVGDH